VRSAAFDAYDGAAHYLVNAQQLDALLGGDELDADPVSPPVHLDAGAVANPTGRSLELAAKMFANGARHVTVMDGSFNDDVLRDAADLPYDCHHRRGEKDLVEITSVGVFGALSALASLIAVPGHLYTLPTIDLDSTLIRIFTEFGREPNPGIYGGGGAAIASSGREHFGTATLMVLIGGPVTQRGIQGSITTAMSGLNTADVSDPLTPTDVYAALLLAAGVDPFASDNLTSGDNFSPLILDEGISPATLRMRLKEQVLGVAP
jgi:hypothetical protein